MSRPSHDPREIPEAPVFYTTAEVAAICRVDSQTIQKWVRAGTFPRPVRLGNRWRFPVDEIDQYFKDARDAEGAAS